MAIKCIFDERKRLRDKFPSSMDKKLLIKLREGMLKLPYLNN